MLHWKSFSRTILLFALLTSLLAGLFAPTFVDESVSAAPKMAVSAGDVVISEFRTRGLNGAGDEFVEIYNPKNYPIDVGGLLIRTAPSSGGSGSTRYTFPSGIFILQPGQHYVVTAASPDYSGSITETPPAVLSSSGIANDAGIAITLADGTTIIDAVGMSAGTIYKETASLSALGSDSDQSYERKGLGCIDTGNNSADFFLRTTSNPQNMANPVVLCTDLSLSMGVDNQFPISETNVVFTITVTNSGPNDATGVTVKDLLPAGFSYVSNDRGSEYDNNTGIWTVSSTLAIGASATLKITATALMVGTHTNSAEIWSSSQGDPYSGNNYAFVSVNPQPSGSADLSVTQTPNTFTPGIGDNVVFTITVSNVGPSDATYLFISDSLPTGLAYVSDNSGGTYNSTTGIWFAGTLVSGTSKSLKITANVTTSGPKTNTAEVSQVNQTDPNPSNNSASVTVTPSSLPVDLSLTQSWGKASPGVAGNVTFTIRVENLSLTNDATNVEVRDVLPSGLTYVSNDLGAVYNKTSGIWTVGTVTKGTNKTLKITAKVLTSGTKTNLAEIWQSDQFDPVSSNNSASQIPEMVDLSLTKSMSNVTPNVGTDVSFTIRVSNATDFDDATNVKVMDSLPTSYTYVSDSGSGAYVSSTGIWTVGSLTSGSSKTLTITATVNSSTLSPNKAEVYDATQVDIDSVPANAVTTEDDYASAPAADLNLIQSVNNVNPDVGAEVVFTITVHNAGVGGTTNVQVKDLLPSGLTYVSNDRGTAYTSSTGIWVVGTLANGASQTLKITAKVAANGIKTNWAEVWKSDQSDPDSHPANSSTTEDDDASATITSFRSIIINEVAWGGTAASSSDEWLELYNPSSASIDISGWTLKSASGSINIILSGTIKANEYFLLERDDNNTISDIVADQIYTGALSDNGEKLELRDGAGSFIDTANQEGFTNPTNPWPKGSDKTPWGTMERQGITAEFDKSWGTNTGSLKNGKDANNGLIFGTPRRLNSTGTSSTNPGAIKTATPAPRLFGRLIINEFLARPGFDWNQDGKVNVFDEFIEIKNVGAADISLSGWKLDDEANLGSAPFALPAVTLKPFEYIVFYGLETNILLSDGGDTVRLLNTSSQVTDSITYTIAKAEDQSTCRLPDTSSNEFGFGEWFTDCIPTPNLANTRNGTVPSMPGGENFEPAVCALPDTLPADFLFAECRGYGSNIWNTFYWDQPGWQGEQTVPENMSKWESFVK